MPTSPRTASAHATAVKEEHVEYGFIGKRQNLKYEYRVEDL